MSYALNPLKTVQVLDPIMQINEEREYAILRGGSEVSWKPILSTSFSNNSAQFTAPPPSPGIVVDRKVYISMPVTLNFTGTTSGGNLLQSGYDAFRAFPISSILNVLNVTVNNTASSINMSDVIQALLRYHNNEHLQECEYSMTPSYMDQSQNYSDLVNTTRNPLGPYGETPFGSVMPRGGFPYIAFTNNTTTAQVQAVLTEPLFLSPYLFGQGNHSGFIGVQNLDFTFNWNSDLTRLWSHASGSGSTISSISVTLGQPSLLFKYITPQETMMLAQHVPYPYFSVDRYPTDANQSITSNSIVTLSSQNIQLQSIPRRMYIFARKRNADLTYNDTDTFFSIKNISINWNNRSGLLSSASQNDLYNISKKNGVNLSWSQWSGGPNYVYSGSNTAFGSVGSVLCIEMGTDIGLQDLEAPGALGTYQLQMNVTVQNINQSASINPSLYIVTVSEGIFTIQDNRSVSQVGVISRQDILDAKSSPMIDYHDIEQVMGSGNFFGDLKRFGKKAVKNIYKGVKIAAPYAEKALPYVLKYGPQVAELLAAGEGGAKRRRKGGVLVGGCEYCNDGCEVCQGSAQVGGKMISRAQLRKRLR